MHVAICGGGIIAACTAYYLTARGIAVTVIERTGVANAASGKAGGFLALDWCDGSPLDALARRSFALHTALARDVAAGCGYRPMTAYAGYVVPRASNPVLDWLSDRVQITARLSTPETTAIVDAGRFTRAMMRAAEAQGAALRMATVTRILHDDGAVHGVALGTDRLDADAVVIAMGPWSALASAWLPLPPVFARRSPSVIFDTGTDVPADALFLDGEDEQGAPVTIEVFPRAGGHTYVTAYSAQIEPPEDPASVVPTDDEIGKLRALAVLVSPALARAKVVARQACARPITADLMPLIGAVPGLSGAYVATGHNAWGILNAPATGEALAALIAGETPETDLRPFSPARLRPRARR
jgi:glycine/D-amino acid oxidase-like deaminating enzyme